MGTIDAEMSSIAFGLFTLPEIRNLSVVEIKTSASFNALDHPLKAGLYDLIMGPSGPVQDLCETCKQPCRHCPGHFGHIELPLPVVNPLFHRDIYILLHMSCYSCFKMLLPSRVKCLLINRLELLDAGHVTEAQELSHIVMNMEKDNTSEEALGYLIDEEVANYLKGLDLNMTETTSTKTTESLRRQFIHEALEAVFTLKSCAYCKNPLRRVTRYQNKLMIVPSKVEIAEKFRDAADKRSKPITTIILPEESREMLRKIWKTDRKVISAFLPVLKQANVEYPTDLLYMEAVLVSPPRTRPVNFVNGRMVENNQSKVFKAIINSSVIVRHIIKAVQNSTLDVLSEEVKSYVSNIKGETATDKLHEALMELQSDVDHLLDADINRLTSSVGLLGVKQIIEKKQGILRMHMMGKRVNFAARSVITPDPNLQIDEIGVPEYFAKRLTYPVRVNSFNVKELRRMVRNGPSVYPGATVVENENGTLIRLFGGNENSTRRESVAKLLLKSVESDVGKRKIVHRHLLNGDMLLLNRQPTLHRPSIMAHKVRILKTEKTLRLHYSNCKSYNADFDGDEMNAHFPQNELARSEAHNIVNVSNHYLVPKDGTPLGGLIQDHVISGVRLTLRGRFFDSQEYQQLVYQGLSHFPGSIQIMKPAIIKPRQLWSGKQIISTILINIIPKNREWLSLTASAKIGANAWQKNKPRRWRCGREFESPKEMSESEVIIRKAELVCGVLDKQHYGATLYGLTHCLYELYGGDCSTKFLGALGKLFTSYLQLNGFTIGVEDILVKKHPDQKRKKVIHDARSIGDIAASSALDLDEVPPDLTERLEKAYFEQGAKFKARLDQEYKKRLDEFTNSINKVCLPQGLVSRFPDNNLQLMVTSGAKGSTVNTMQISCLLGQIELEGKRPPWMISGKSLPSFKAFETTPVAGGYVDGRFMTGINPQDFFFHCMAGREGLIDTAVKTSRSGYLQRCLIKHLEGVTVCYDGTVRDHDGSVIQFAYGEDGMEVQKSTFLNLDQMKFLHENWKIIVDESVLKTLKDSESREIGERRKEIQDWRETNANVPRKAPFTSFSMKYASHEKFETHRRIIEKDTGRPLFYGKMLKKWKKRDEEKKQRYRYIPIPDPVTSRYRHYRDFGAITEKLDKLINDYLKAETDEKEATIVEDMISVKYLMSQCEPGDPVGLLASQSIGEPSTQMTLNTFHFAGRGDMNVTLGIPRLREILMTASKNIKTPSMDIPLHEVPLKNVLDDNGFPMYDELGLKEKAARKVNRRAKELTKIFRRVTVSDVLEKITVDEKLQATPTRLFTYTVRFNFLPHKAYKKEFDVTPKDVLRYMERSFFAALSKEVRKLGKKFGDLIHESKEEKAMSKVVDDENAADEIDAAGIEPRKREKAQEESSDEDDEMEDDDATTAKLRVRHQESQEYEDPEDSEKESSEDEYEVEELLEERNRKSDAENGNDGEEITLTEEERRSVENRQNEVLKVLTMVKNYSFDIVKEEWCEVVLGVPLTMSKINFSTLLREICDRSVLHEVPKIKRAIAYERNGVMNIKTEGVNLIEAFKFNDYLNLNKLYSNDIHMVAQTYGIEAAGRVIVKELKDVFSVYGITVNPRHLLLISDYMTFQGEFTPLNRKGMGDSPSPFQQMSFESSTGFLKQALFSGKKDMLQSPSARIMVGKPCISGTGCFDVISDTRTPSKTSISNRSKKREI